MGVDFFFFSPRVSGFSAFFNVMGCQQCHLSSCAKGGGLQKPVKGGGAL